MKRYSAGVAVAVVLVWAAGSVHGADGGNFAGEVASLKTWFGQKTASGEWDGMRDQLDRRGVTISSNFTTDIGGNPAGGLKQVTKYSGFLALTTALDLEKIAGLKGWGLAVSNYLASGRDLSGAIGNFFGAQEIYAPGAYFFGELDLSVSLAEDTLTLETGRLFAGDVFATSPLWGYYVNGGINDNLNSMPANIFFPAFNITAWAVRATYQPRKEWQLVAAMYNADPDVAKVANRGADFSFRMKDGYLAIGQLTYQHHQAREEKGLPGSATAGCYYESGRFQDLVNATKRWHGNYGFYAYADQMIYKEGDWPEFQGPWSMRGGASYAERAKQHHYPRTAVAADRPKGLTAWAAGYIAPQDHINTQTYQLAGGLVYQGLPPNRDLDATAFCFILGNFSRQLEGQGIETVLELNHRFQVGPWFYVTPDIQYIIKPNGQSGIDNALVLGVEISANF